jgi:hypothetical protein
MFEFYLNHTQNTKHKTQNMTEIRCALKNNRDEEHGISRAKLVPCVVEGCRNNVSVCPICLADKKMKNYILLCQQHVSTCYHCNNTKVTGSNATVPAGVPEVYVSMCARNLSLNPMRLLPCLTPFAACYHCRVEQMHRKYLCPKHYENEEDYITSQDQVMVKSKEHIGKFPEQHGMVTRGRRDTNK